LYLRCQVIGLHVNLGKRLFQ